MGKGIKASNTDVFIGNMSELTTDEKTNLVGAVNELDSVISELSDVAISGDYSDLENSPIVDSDFSTTSQNALQNKVLTTKLQSLEAAYYALNATKVEKESITWDEIDSVTVPSNGAISAYSKTFDDGKLYKKLYIRIELPDTSNYASAGRMSVKTNVNGDNVYLCMDNAAWIANDELPKVISYTIELQGKYAVTTKRYSSGANFIATSRQEINKYSNMGYVLTDTVGVELDNNGLSNISFTMDVVGCPIPSGSKITIEGVLM